MRKGFLLVLASLAILSSTALQARSLAVKVVNLTDDSIFVHKGGYANSIRIAPHSARLFSYPFYGSAPGEHRKERTGELVLSAGGNWMTNAGGMVYLQNPMLLRCVDYDTLQNKTKGGVREWVVRDMFVDASCAIKKYHEFKNDKQVH